MFCLFCVCCILGVLWWLAGLVSYTVAVYTFLVFMMCASSVRFLCIPFMLICRILSSCLFCCADCDCSWLFSGVIWGVISIGVLVADVICGVPGASALVVEAIWGVAGVDAQVAGAAWGVLCMV